MKWVTMFLMIYLHKICVPSDTKDVNVKVLNMIAKIIEAKTFYVIVNVNLIKWNNGECQCECKKYHTCQKIIDGILAHVFVRILSI